MSLTFPVDLTDRYYFDLKFKTYSRPNPYTGAINLGAPSEFGAAGSGHIRLPIPANLMDSQKLVWKTEENIDGLAGAAADSITGNLDATGAAGASLATRLASAGAGAISSLIGNAVVGDAAAYAMQRLGVALNPVLTQTFKNPEFKEHTFSWTLAPETANESRIAQEIIDLIKFQSLPANLAGGAFFAYPAIAMVQIFSGNNGNLYNFQPAVVTSVNVNYAPKGVPSFFAGSNAPTLISLEIHLLEIILNTRDNFNNTSNISGFDFSLGGIRNNAVINSALSSVRNM